MDKINKFLKSLGLKRRSKIKAVLVLILNDDLESLDCKKLQGFKDCYRVRVGQDRIVFRKMPEGNLIIDIFRRERGYKRKD